MLAIIDTNSARSQMLESRARTISVRGQDIFPWAVYPTPSETSKHTPELRKLQNGVENALLKCFLSFKNKNAQDKLVPCLIAVTL